MILRTLRGTWGAIPGGPLSEREPSWVVAGLPLEVRKTGGGAFRPLLWHCPKCRRVLCEKCTPGKKVGLIFKKPVCPDCLLELSEGGINSAKFQK